MKFTDNLFTSFSLFMSTLLFEAAEAGDLKKISEYLQNAQDVNENNSACDEQWGGDAMWDSPTAGLSPLFGAVRGCQVETVKFLIEHKANVNQEGNCYHSAWYPLTYAGHLLQSVFDRQSPYPKPVDSVENRSEKKLENEKETNAFLTAKDEFDSNPSLDNPKISSEWKLLLEKENKYYEIIDLLISNGAYAGFDDVKLNHSSAGPTMLHWSSGTNGMTAFIMHQGNGALRILPKLIEYRAQLIKSGCVHPSILNEKDWIVTLIKYAETRATACSIGSTMYYYPLHNDRLLTTLQNFLACK